MLQRKKLTDILRNGGVGGIRRAWESTQAADDFKPLPEGEYLARIVTGELFTSKSNATPGYKLAFEVAEGEHVGRRFWHDLWLTPAALPMTKRDLAKIGVNSPEQLELLLPPGIICNVKLALRRDDDGTEYNKVRSFQVERIETPEPDPFAPSDGVLNKPIPEAADTSFDSTKLDGCDARGPAV